MMQIEALIWTDTRLQIKAFTWTENLSIFKTPRDNFNRRPYLDNNPFDFDHTPGRSRCRASSIQTSSLDRKAPSKQYPTGVNLIFTSSSWVPSLNFEFTNPQPPRSIGYRWLQFNKKL